jgi:hypothetical protein
MEQQTTGTRHIRLPLPFLTREQSWLKRGKRVGEGGSERPIGLSHWPLNARVAGANPT